MATAMATAGCGTDPVVGLPTHVDAGADGSSSGSGKVDGGGTDNVPAATFSVGGTVSGLSGTGMVIQNNGGDDLTVNANGTFVFSTKVESGSSFAITIKKQPTAPTQTCTVSGGVGTVASGNVTSVAINCTVDTFTVGGTVSGLEGTGLVLQDAAGATVNVSANGTFAFPPREDGTSYAISVKTQPSSPSQTCALTNGTGTLSGADVTNVDVVCTKSKFTVGGTVTGLAGTGLVLRNNGGNDLAVAADGTFTFTTALDDGAAYAVTVETQPIDPVQTCTIAGGSGTLAGGNVTAVTVNCATNEYTVGGTVTGLAGTGLVLQNNAGDDITIGANGTFAFPSTVASGAAYAVSVKTQPSNKWQTCVVTDAAGTIGASAVSNVAVSCKTNTYAIGGTLSGLASGASVVLQNAGGDALTLTANGAFSFATKIESGAVYSASVLTQPASPSQTCTVATGNGTVTNANVAAITVTCVTNAYTIGGTATGVVGAGLVLRNNGGDDLAVAADGTFTFATSIASGASFDVTVATQPSGPSQSCTVTGGAGTVSAGNVVSVAVNCATNQYTVGGTVTGLDGTGLVLQNSGGDDLAINVNGSFAFATPLTDLSAYAVTVLADPTANSQTCSVTNGSGALAGANVTDVAITCVTNAYTVGGTISGLDASESVVLQNNGGDDLTRNANGAFTFATSVDSGSPYAVTVLTPPSGKACTTNGATGTVTNGNVTNVTITCAALPTTCSAIKLADPTAVDGNYTIDPDGPGAFAPLTVFCDMTTDGGGYMSYAVTGGIPTNRFDQANSCQALGLQMVVPRTAAHAFALFSKYGQSFFQTVPGVYGLAAGNYTGCAMNSSDPTCSANWKAIDGGSWFLKPAPYSEPNGDYTPGCWLGTDNQPVTASGFQRFNDLSCGYSTGPNYVCSDNVKGRAYGEDFSGAITTQCTRWNDYRASLSAGITYSSITFRGSATPTVHTCTGADANTICQALRAGTPAAVTCGGENWFVGTCGNAAADELQVGPSATGSCRCESADTMRACYPFSQQWGGMGAGGQCDNPPAAQRMEVICQ